VVFFPRVAVGRMRNIETVESVLMICMGWVLADEGVQSQG